MKKHLILLLATALCATACEDGDDVFYTVEYPITDLQTKVEVTGAAPDSPILDEIAEHIVITAPVAVGGVYSMDFSVYNGGALRVKPNDQAEVIGGTFTKEPGERVIHFMYGEQDYIAKTSYYQSQEKDPATGLYVRNVVFIVDLTDKYQEMYPDREIARAIRYEYTATRTK